MKTSHDSEILREGQQVITAVAFIYKVEGGVVKLFSPKRAETKKFLPGVFELPGGHIDFGEELKVGLGREVMEEFNMEIKIGDAFHAFTYLNEIKKSHSVEIMFFAKFTSPMTQLALNPEDHSEFIWFGEDELEEIVKQNGKGWDEEMLGMKKGFKVLG